MTAASIAAVIFFQGCGSGIPKPRVVTFRNQAEAGSVTVGTQTVAPFEDYIDLLQPKFPLTTEVALAQAIPVTQTVRIRELRELLAALQLAFPVTAQAEMSSSTTTVTSSDTGAGPAISDTSTTTRTGTQESTSPVAPAASIPAAIQRSLQALTELDSSTLQTDPMLRYRAATALFQEVALLSSYVREAAVSNDTVPYIARQLVTVLPSARRARYDVHLTLAYFSADPRPLPYTLYAGQSDDHASGVSSCVGKPVSVIPLFVTDSVETSLVQSDRAGVRDLGFSAGGASTAVGFAVGGKSRHEVGEETASRELNSLLTVGRAADNALTMRVGASFVESTYSLVPRTFNITALVLVPATNIAGTAEKRGGTVLPCRQVRYALDAHFTDSVTGNRLPRTSHQDTVTRLEAMGIEAPDQALFHAAVANDFDLFRSRLASSVADEQRLWVQYVSAAATSGLGGGSFSLPSRQIGFFVQSTDWGTGAQAARNAILDDGKSAILRVSGAYGLADGSVEGRLRFKTTTREVEFVATSVKLEGGGRIATVTFPSVLKVDATVSEATVALFHAPLLQRWSPRDAVDAWRVALPVVSYKDEPEKAPSPQFEIVASSDQLRVTSAGQGQLAVTFKRAKEATPPFSEVLFSINGGHVVSASPALTSAQGVHKASVDTIYTLNLGGLVPGSKLRLEAWRLESKVGGKPGETVAVVAPPVTAFVVGPEPAKE